MMSLPPADQLLMWFAGILTSITAIVGGAMLLHRWMLHNIRRDIQDVSAAVADVRKEVHPNHGSSLRDSVDFIRERQAEMMDEVRGVRAKVDDHIEWHLERK